MDELDKIILRSANSVQIKVHASSQGHFSNSIYINFGLPQGPEVWNEQPLSRVKQWATGTDLTENTLLLPFVPPAIDALDIAVWIASQYKAQGKTVKLEKWVAPQTYVLVEDF